MNPFSSDTLLCLLMETNLLLFGAVAAKALLGFELRLALLLVLAASLAWQLIRCLWPRGPEGEPGPQEWSKSSRNPQELSPEVSAWREQTVRESAERRAAKKREELPRTFAEWRKALARIAAEWREARLDLEQRWQQMGPNFILFHQEDSGGPILLHLPVFGFGKPEE